MLLSARSGTLTTHLRTMVAEGANHEDIVGYLQDRNLPGDEIVLQDLANESLTNPPEQGVLTISLKVNHMVICNRVYL